MGENNSFKKRCLKKKSQDLNVFSRWSFRNIGKWRAFESTSPALILSEPIVVKALGSVMVRNYVI